MTELIASTQSEYVQIAVKLATDNLYRQTIRKKVWEKRTSSKLFNVENYAESLDDLFEVMFAKYEEKQESGVVGELAGRIESEKTIGSILNYINYKFADGHVDLEVDDWINKS